jgi:hypothetical protein
MYLFKIWRPVDIYLLSTGCPYGYICTVTYTYIFYNWCENLSISKLTRIRFKLWLGSYGLFLCEGDGIRSLSLKWSSGMERKRFSTYDSAEYEIWIYDMELGTGDGNMGRLKLNTSLALRSLPQWLLLLLYGCVVWISIHRIIALSRRSWLFVWTWNSESHCIVHVGTNLWRAKQKANYILTRIDLIKF